MKPEAQALLSPFSSKAAKIGKREPLFERQGKTIYHSDKPDFAVQEFFPVNGKADGNMAGSNVASAVLRNEISSYLFEYLEGFRIPTHYIGRISDNEMAVRKTDPLPLTVIVSNYGVGALARRVGLQEGATLEFPIIEHFFLRDATTSTWVNEHHLYALNVVTPEEFKQINRIASKVNAVLRGLCDRRQLALVSIQLGFGRSKSQMILVDELSPLTCHVWDTSTDDRRRRDRFLPDQTEGEPAVAELRDRLMLKG